MSQIIIDADELYHSKGPWLTHKYIRREGINPPYKYFYGEKTSTGEKVGEEQEVFLTERRKNNVTGGYTNHHVDNMTIDYRSGDYFEDAEGNRVAKVHPNSKYGLEFFDTPHKAFSEAPIGESISFLRERGMDFITNRLKKAERTYDYTNRAKDVEITGDPSEYAATPRRKRKPR